MHFDEVEVLRDVFRSGVPRNHGCVAEDGQRVPPPVSPVDHQRPLVEKRQQRVQPTAVIDVVMRDDNEVDVGDRAAHAVELLDEVRPRIDDDAIRRRGAGMQCDEIAAAKRAKR